jgi:colanic acid/amylovoran biosynthesis glycosyltransferase
MNVAIVSPDQNVYSETYIQAHKRIDAKVFYYYGGLVPTHLEGVGSINRPFLFDILTKIQAKFFNKNQPYSDLVFAKSLRKNKIDVVFAEYGPTGASLVNVCKSLKMPLVTIFHGRDASAYDVLEKYRQKYTDLFHYAGRILVVSGVMREKLIALGCPGNKVVLTQCAPDNKFLELNPTFREPKSFVSIGRFINKKAPYYDVLAIKQVAEKYPDVKLYFAGEGELLNSTQNLIRYFNLEDNIKLLGIISPDEFAEILSKVTGFIQHSITAKNGDMEGTPVSVMEASAAGIPVIATRHAGIPDVIIDGETGLLVDEHDVDGMVKQILKLIENPGLAKSLGQAGKENIRINFNMGKHLGIIRSVLQEALETGKSDIS